MNYKSQKPYQDNISFLANRIIQYVASQPPGDSLIIIPRGPAASWRIANEIYKADKVKSIRTSRIRVVYDDDLNNQRLRGIEFSNIFVEIGCCKADTIHDYTLPDHILCFANKTKDTLFFKFDYHDECILRINPVVEDTIPARLKFMTMSKSNSFDVKFYGDEKSLLAVLTDDDQSSVNIYGMVPMRIKTAIVGLQEI